MLATGRYHEVQGSSDIQSRYIHIIRQRKFDKIGSNIVDETRNHGHGDSCSELQTIITMQAWYH